MGLEGPCSMLAQLACLILAVAAASGGGAKLSAADNWFALRLLPVLPRSEDQNVFYSPYSVATALGMAYAGARGTTRRELYDALGYATARIEEGGVAVAHSEQRLLLLAPSNSTIKVANAAVVNEDLNVLPSYVDILKRYFGAELFEADFARAGRKAVDSINTWVSQKTQHKISTLFDEPLDKATRLILINAIYFKGTWRTMFDKAKTVMAPFHADGAFPTEVRTMRGTMKTGYAHAREIHAHVLDLPYAGLDYSMTILLPQRRGIEALKRNLTLEALGRAVSRLRETMVEVHLPRFRLEETYMLRDVLPKVGVRKMFDDSEADLSGVTGGRDLCVTDVVHKAVVEVNEEGSEASAVSSAVITSRMAPLRFRADRPFLFFIRNSRTRAVLFVGQVNRVP